MLANKCAVWPTLITLPLSFLSLASLIERNCCTFSNELAIGLGVGECPAWINNMANTFVPLARGASAVSDFPRRISRSTSDIFRGSEPPESGSSEGSGGDVRLLM